MINVWEIEDSGSIYMLRHGNVLNCRSGMINLLLSTNDDGEGHYIYVKKIERMLHSPTCTFYKYRKVCPFCNKTVKCCDQTFKEHLVEKHYSTTNNCNLEMPEEGSTMKFKN